MSLVFQSTYDVNQGDSFVGQLASQPGSIVIPGTVNVPNNGKKPQPGFPVFYNSSNDGWEVPTTAANIRRIQGIVLYRTTDIPNDSNVVEFDTDDLIDILIRGQIFLKAGGAFDPFTRITWDNGDEDWIAGAAPTVAAHTPTADNVAANINGAITSLRNNVNAAINALGYTRLQSIHPNASTSGSNFLAYLSGSGIV